jgi:hypothetical protein
MVKLVKVFDYDNESMCFLAGGEGNNDIDNFLSMIAGIVELFNQ